MNLFPENLNVSRDELRFEGNKKEMFPNRPHRTKYQESVNGNVVEICETVAETRRSTRVSASGLVTFTRVSVAAVPTEPDHFFRRFRQVSVEGNV